MISQREAKRMRALLAKYQDRERWLRSGWLNEWPEGQSIARLSADDKTTTAVRTAGLLGFPVVATVNCDDVVFTAIRVEGIK